MSEIDIRLTNSGFVIHSGNMPEPRCAGDGNERYFLEDLEGGRLDPYRPADEDGKSFVAYKDGTLCGWHPNRHVLSSEARREHGKDNLDLFSVPPAE